MALAVANSSTYLVIFMISMSYHCIAPLASTVPTNYTASDMLVTTSVHGRPVTNTTVTMAEGVPSVNFLEHEAPLLLPPSGSKGWGAVDDSNLATHRYRVLTSKAPRDDPVTGSAPCRGNCTSRTDRVSPRNHNPSPFVPPVASNGSTAERLPPISRRVQRRVHRRHKEKGGTIKLRKLLGVYHHQTRLQSEPTGSRVAAVAVGSVVSVLLCVLAGLLPWCMCRNAATAASIHSESEEDESILRPELLQQAAGPGRYNYCELAAATSNFAQSKRIGRGGFGSVYCGYLDEQDRHVAVKMFSMESLDQGSTEFEHEVKIMSQLRHRNVVQLVGWWLLLVYELVSGGSLDKCIHDPEKLLTWQERYKIALGLGSAIQYLHTECNQCVVHGDIKPSNIMLDSSNNAKLGDFGLARLVDHGAEPQATQVIAGTVGYMDPEFVSSQKRGTESDIYSFGIVLLEIASGTRPVASGRPAEASVLLLRRIWDMYDRNSILDAADRRLGGDFDGHQMERMLVTGLWCAHRHKSQRPSIEQAMIALRLCKDDFESPVVPVPLPAMHLPDSEQIRSLEEQAYGDLSTGSSSSACLSAATIYHTVEYSSHLQQANLP